MNLIYDFETLSQNPDNGPIVSIAALVYDPDVEYDYSQLVNMAKYMKFDIAEQCKKYNRIIDLDTVSWWQSLGTEAQKQIIPRPSDVSITELYNFFVDTLNGIEVKRVYTRGNDFDPIFLKSILKTIDKPFPYSWWKIRDTRSYIEGLSFGGKMGNSFIPEGLNDKIVLHNPIHDIALDVMRMQVLIKAIS